MNFARRMVQKASSVAGASSVALADSDPAELIDDMVRMLAESGRYPILIVERFQSFARLADHATVSLLSQLRSLEHEFALTTILISTHSCSAIRRRLPSALAFVNSAYGDNHDEVIMPFLAVEEFAASAPHLSPELAADVFALGAGPDPIFQALIDESHAGLEGLSDRAWLRSRDRLADFINDLFGQIEITERNLLRAAIAGPLEARHTAHLGSLPHANFLFDLARIESSPLRGVLAERAAGVAVSQTHSIKENPMRLLICSANPDFDLDLEKEVRAIRRVSEAVAGSGKIVIESIGAATPDDLLMTIRRFRPTAVHFCGHGCADGVVMRGDGEETHVVSGPAMAAAFKGRGIDLVVLNSCFSSVQADPMSESVPSIIGTTEKVQDEAAIRFSTAFYRTLFDGETLAEAFRDGRDALGLYNLNDVYSSRGDLGRRPCAEANRD